LSVTVNLPDLTIIKEVSADNVTWSNTSVTVGVGDTVYYQITVDNTGSVDLTNVVVTDNQCTLSAPTGDTGNDNILGTAETWVYTCSVTAALGTHTNTASIVTTELPTPRTDGASYSGVSADLSLTKTVDNSSPHVGDNVIFTITVTNNGPSNATGVVVGDLLPAGLTYVSDNGGAAYNDSTGNWTIGNLNNGVSVSLKITATVVQAGSITNTAEVTDSDQADPNSTPGNNDPAENDQASVIIGSIFDPPSAIKTFNASGLPELEFRMVWINSGNAFSINVQVVDQIPTGTVYVPGSLTCVPQGVSSNAAVASSPLSLAAIPSSFCGYDAALDRIQWQGNMGPDNGHLTEAAANNEVVITFRVTVNSGVNQVQNQGFSRTDVDADTNFDEETILGTSLVGSNRVVWNRNIPATPGPDDLPGRLPATGFAPNVVTTLPEQPVEKMYTATDVWMEIPSLGVNTSIVGVPLVNGDWNISWLDKQAGWLNGTAFPGWKGNSVLTGHVYLSNGKPGPFVELGKLKWGDRIIVHADGSVYTYEVRENRTVSPTDTSILKHEENSWLTLITCKSYKETTNTYANRIAVRAVLVNAQTEK